MRILGNGYQITLSSDVLAIEGKLSLMLEEYKEIDQFFKTAIQTVKGGLTVDIRQLEYLNSAGIHTFCVKLILEAAEIEGYFLKILCSRKFTWQKETIPTLEDLMENMQIIFE